MPKSKEFVESDDSSSNSETEKKGKKRSKKEIKDKDKEAKGGSSSKKSKNDSGEPVWDLGQNRQVTVRKWKGKTYIDIRQMFLDAKGDWKHGKGISLTPELWNNFMEVVEDVNKTVKEQY